VGAADRSSVVTADEVDDRLPETARRGRRPERAVRIHTRDRGLKGRAGAVLAQLTRNPWRAGRTGNLPFPPVRWDWRMLTACLDCGAPCQRSRCERDGGNRRALTTDAATATSVSSAEPHSCQPQSIATVRSVV
jgi:hypothetical protein